MAIHHLGAAQLVAKMSLKTSSNMPVHGLDGIHASVKDGGAKRFFP
ncbi:Hachiman antiphage defense system protein HamA [Pseudomonas proteolytica]